MSSSRLSKHSSSSMPLRRYSEQLPKTRSDDRCSNVVCETLLGTGQADHFHAMRFQRARIGNSQRKRAVGEMKSRDGTSIDVRLARSNIDDFALSLFRCRPGFAFSTLTASCSGEPVQGDVCRENQIRSMAALSAWRSSIGSSGAARQRTAAKSAKQSFAVAGSSIHRVASRVRGCRPPLRHRADPGPAEPFPMIPWDLLGLRQTIPADPEAEAGRISATRAR